MAYGEQQENLKRTMGVVRKAGSLPALKQSVYKNWKLSTLDQMMDAMKPAYQGQAKSLAQSMFPTPAPINIVPGGGIHETMYIPMTGMVNIGERLKPTIPLAAYAHEQSHALQRGPGAQWDDTNFTDFERRSANELAPTLAGNLAEYEARRRSGGQALNAPTPLAGSYQPSLEWMRQQAGQHGLYGGKPMEQLLAENPQFVKMLAERAGQGQQPAYESGSLMPSTADSFEGDGQMGKHMVMPYSTAQGRQVQRDKFGRPFRSERTMGPGFSLDTPPRRVASDIEIVVPRSPTVAAPGTPEEIRRAFGGPIAFAPGASREQTASAALRLAGPRFGPGEYAEHQRSIGVNQDQAGDGQGLTGWQVLAMPMVVHAMAGRLRQAQQAAAENVRPGGAGFPEAYLGGQSKMLVPGINGNVSNQTLGAQRVGQGVRSSGMTTGGTFGSSVMLGPGPGGESPTRQPFAYKPGRGPTITSPGGQSGVVSPEAFQQMWNQMSGNARGGALRMALADQRKLAAADPRIAANIARNEAAQQRQQGGAPIVTDPEQRQAMWNREMQRKELSRAGVPRPLAATLANLHGNPEAQAALVEQLAGEETGGQRGRERAGAGVTGVVAAQATARDAAARQKLEGDKLRLDQIKAQWGPRLQMAQAALMPGSTATPAERRAAQQTIDEYNRLTFTDSAFGGRQVMPPSQPGTQQLGQPGTNTSAPIPPEYVPYGSSGVMVDPQSVTQLETIAANYSANPAAVGAQLVQMMNGPEFAHLDAAKKQALLQDLVGRYRPNPTLAHPEGIYGGNRGPSFDGGSMEALGFAGGIM